LFKRKSGSVCFGTKMAPCLWRADLSFMNSVTGSGNKAKCSNILQDRFILRHTFFGVTFLFEYQVSTGIVLLIASPILTLQIGLNYDTQNKHHLT